MELAFWNRALGVGACVRGLSGSLHVSTEPLGVRMVALEGSEAPTAHSSPLLEMVPLLHSGGASDPLPRVDESLALMSAGRIG